MAFTGTGGQGGGRTIIVSINSRRPWSGSDAGQLAWRAEVARRVGRWQERRAMVTVLWPVAALALALASWAVLLSGRAAAPVLAALALGIVVWRVLATWGRP
jgi:hypothetical protein